MDLLRYRKPLLVALVGALALLLLAQRVQGGGSPSPAPGRATPVGAAKAAPVGQLVVVDVVGAVRRPGLYRLPPGSRVADAVRRAGGATAHANLELLNLAAPLADGEQVVVPRAGGAPAEAAAAPAGAGMGAVAPLQLSVATAEQLDALPGVGPATAAKIVAYRQKHGPFKSVDDLVGVPGIGPAKLAALKDLVVP